MDLILETSFQTNFNAPMTLKMFDCVALVRYNKQNKSLMTNIGIVTGKINEKFKPILTEEFEIINLSNT